MLSLIILIKKLNWGKGLKGSIEKIYILGWLIWGLLESLLSTVHTAKSFTIWNLKNKDNVKKKMRSTATPNLLQSLPPISVSPRNPSLLAHSSLTSPPKRTLDITCASKRSPDDYHATLKALNSRDRRPRKSLGQVLHIPILFS
jgi:hypothetical protein